MCVAFECEERGVFISGDIPWTEEEVSGCLAGDLGANLTMLHELLTKRVARKDNRGAIFNARMVRDEQIRKERIKAGSMGGRPTKYKYFNVVSSKSKTKAKVKQNTEYVNESENGNEKLLKTKKLNSKTLWEDSPLFEFHKFREKLADWSEAKVRYYHNLFSVSDPGQYIYADWSCTARRWDEKNPWKDPNRNGQFKAKPIEDFEINQEELQKAIANTAAELAMDKEKMLARKGEKK